MNYMFVLIVWMLVGLYVTYQFGGVTQFGEKE